MPPDLFHEPDDADGRGDAWEGDDDPLGSGEPPAVADVPAKPKKRPGYPDRTGLKWEPLPMLPPRPGFDPKAADVAAKLAEFRDGDAGCLLWVACVGLALLDRAGAVAVADEMRRQLDRQNQPGRAAA